MSVNLIPHYKLNSHKLLKKGYILKYIGLIIYQRYSIERNFYKEFFVIIVKKIMILAAYLFFKEFFKINYL